MRIGLLLAVACALLCALIPALAFAQEQRDPLIDPSEGEVGGRFQIVGQHDWVPGETVTITLGFATADPLTFTGPFYRERQVTVLRDGTWSFPISVAADLLPVVIGDVPGYIVVRAQAPSHAAQNAYVLRANGTRPFGADTIAPLGFGPGAPTPAATVALAMFAATAGAMLMAAGALRRFVPA